MDLCFSLYLYELLAFVRVCSQRDDMKQSHFAFKISLLT